MANKMVGALDALCVPNKQRTGKVHTGSSHVSTPANYASVADLRSALQTFNASYYTNALLDKLTTNDMVYAARIHLDGGNSSNGTI
jgi:hypothetical protein